MKQTTLAELDAAITTVVAMSDDEFFDVADAIGLDPFSGMKRGRRSFPGSRRYMSTITTTQGAASECSTSPQPTSEPSTTETSSPHLSRLPTRATAYQRH